MKRWRRTLVKEIIERKQAEEELKGAQAQLIQAEKWNRWADHMVHLNGPKFITVHHT